jgi:hypothetical protein
MSAKDLKISAEEKKRKSREKDEATDDGYAPSMKMYAFKEKEALREVRERAEKEKEKWMKRKIEADEAEY